MNGLTDDWRVTYESREGETVSSTRGATGPGTTGMETDAGVRAPRSTERVGTCWRTRLQVGEAEPLVHDGRVYVRGRSGPVCALDVTDGTELWRSNDCGVGAARPAVGEGLVFVGGADGELRALDASDGTTTWTYQVDGAIEAPPVVRDGTVHVATDRGQVYLVSAESGDRQGAFGNGFRAVCSLAVAPETVLLGSLDGGVQARGIADGRERWRFEPDRAVVARPTVRGEHVYVATIDGDSIRAVSLVTGAIRERFGVGSGVWGRPVVTDDAVFVSARDGVVAAFDRDGTRRWSVRTAGSVWCGPTVADGNVYVADGDGWTYAFDAADGATRWRFKAGAGITTSPAVADGTIVVCDEAGAVYAFGE